MSAWKTFRGRTAGKWQLPLLLVSLVALAGSLLVSPPQPPPIPLHEAIVQLRDLTETGAFGDAADLGDRLRTRPDCTGEALAQTHLWSARATFGQAARKGLKSKSIAKRIAEHYHEAEAGGIELVAADIEHLGRIAEWTEQYQTAVERFERAAGMGLEGADVLRRHVFDLRRDRLKNSTSELSEWLTGFLAGLPEEASGLRYWAVEQQAAFLQELDRAEEAETLLSKEAVRFAESEHAEAFAFLEASNLTALRQFDEGELRLRAIRNRVERDSELNAKAGWLLGRVLLDDGGPHRPLEAISFFEDVIRNHPRSEYVVASRVGLGEALALLERHDEAAQVFAIALEEIQKKARAELVNPTALATSLFVTAESRRLAGDAGAALGYARLAKGLIDREQVETASAILRLFADLAVRAGDRIREAAVGPVPADAVSLYEQATEAYLEIAKINTTQEARASDAAWRAAEACAAGRLTDRAVELFEAFTVNRPGDSLVPRARLRIGQLRHEARQLHAAIAAYEQCYRQFPRTLEGARTLVPLAKCYLSLGGDNLAAAERTLQLILDGAEVFTPDAPEFADAMFLLGDVRLRRENFEGAVSTLSEALDRYPDDSRTTLARFLLADAYRRSGLALRDESSQATFDAELEYIRAESIARLGKARELYRQVVEDVSDRPVESLTASERMYLRHAHLYEADCYFDTQDYPQALKLYEEAAGMYKDQPGGLAAYVQIINCHVFLGQADEAKAALARALVLVESIPEAAFSMTISPQTRGDWKEYFAWLGETGLF